MRSCCEVTFGALTLTPTVTNLLSNRDSVSCRNSLLEFKCFYSVVYLNHCKHLVSPPQPILVKNSNGKYRTSVFARACSTSAHCSGAERPDDEFVVVNFYHFIFIKDPEAEVAKHLSFLQGLDIKGRVYLNEQGINAQYSGPSKDALAYVDWIRKDARFSDMLVQISPSVNGHAFPKLKLRYKPSLVQLEGGISHLPLLDHSMRATPLEPSEWRKKLKAINGTDGYEWDIGHFHGAQRPNVDCFRSTSFGLSQKEATASDPLSNVDKEKTNILMYCTGGIRCDVYSAILRQKGFPNLYTLKGGVSHYLKNEGPADWIGNLFVFDSRLSLPPSLYNPQATGGISRNQVTGNYKFAKCYLCSSEVSELRHRNCANLDCNLLFLCCTKCVKDMRGCCCRNCTTAPRLRPVLVGDQRYRKWHIYRDIDSESKQDDNVTFNKLLYP